MKITNLLFKRYLLGLIFVLISMLAFSLALFTVPFDGLHFLLVKLLKKIERINAGLK